MITRRSSLAIMKNMIGLVGELKPVMALAIIIGSLGHLCASFVTILAGYGILSNYQNDGKTIFIIKLMLVFAILRGIFHYIEQYANHYLAFKILAKIRHLVFKKMRCLAPAKLAGKDKGNLISLITSDIELLEVFYAHTISPIGIAVTYLIIMEIFLGSFSIYQAILALFAYLAIGLISPMIIGRKNSSLGLDLRNKTGDLNSFVLETIRNMEEVKQFDLKDRQVSILRKKSRKLRSTANKLDQIKAGSEALIGGLILGFSFAMLLLSLLLYQNNIVDLKGFIIPTIAMFSSFGPFVALSNLGNILSQTLASGDRVLDLLEEEPMVGEVLGDDDKEAFESAEIDKISFAYENEKILEDFSIKFDKGKIFGLYGKSGSGKSTLLRLLMRFWDVDQGEIRINNENIKEIPSKKLRKMQSLLGQDTYIFNISLKDNIRLAKLDATDTEIIEAAKKASIHDFISSLKDGYETRAGELGSTLSAGERQRIGIARAFLHDSDLMLFDEPTSNLDILNEASILKSIKKESQDKTVLLVSHSLSSLSIADEKIQIKGKRNS